MNIRKFYNASIKLCKERKAQCNGCPLVHSVCIYREEPSGVTHVIPEIKNLEGIKSLQKSWRILKKEGYIKEKGE